MTYEQFETSGEDGRPIEFYTFRLGNQIEWYYTNADHDLTVDGKVYVATTILSTNIQQTGEYVNDALNLDAPSWIAPAQLFMSSPPTTAISVRISYKHAQSDELMVGYVGEIRQVDFPLPGRARINCESLMVSMSREGLRLAWQRACPYALYDGLTCKVDKALWKIDFIVLGINGFSIDVLLTAAKPTDYFNRGFLEWVHPIRGLEHASIDIHTELIGVESNARLLLSMPPGELFEGARGSVYPGCDFTPTNCTAFNNYDNYGGDPDMPGKSPFDGNPVF